MQQTSAVQVLHLEDHQNITDHLECQATTDPLNSLFARQLNEGEWTEITAREFREDVVTVAKGLMARGLQPGDRLAIMAPTRYEWSLVDFAAWYAGAVSVPIYETSSPSQTAWILQDAGVTFVVVGSDSHAEIVDQAIRMEGIETVAHFVTSGP